MLYGHGRIVVLGIVSLSLSIQGCSGMKWFNHGTDEQSRRSAEQSLRSSGPEVDLPLVVGGLHDDLHVVRVGLLEAGGRVTGAAECGRRQRQRQRRTCTRHREPSNSTCVNVQLRSCVASFWAQVRIARALDAATGSFDP